MPKIEVEETDFLKGQNLRKTVEKMLANPKSAKLLKLAETEIDPSITHPELEMEKVVEERVGALAKTVTDFIAESKTQREKDESERRLDKLATSIDAGIAKLRAEEGLTDEGEKALRELMVKKGETDVFDAWAVFQRHNPPPPPAAPSSGRMFDVISTARDGSDDLLKKMIEGRGEDNAAVDKAAWDAINEVRAANGTQRR
jgi:hypothetical protein